MNRDSSDTVRDQERIAAEFLRSAFRGHETGFVALFNKPSKHSTFLSLDSDGWYAEAARIAMLAREKENVYFAIGVQGQRPHQGRGKETGVIARPDFGLTSMCSGQITPPRTYRRPWKMPGVLSGRYRSSPPSLSIPAVVFSFIGFSGNRWERLLKRTSPQRSGSQRGFSGSWGASPHAVAGVSTIPLTSAASCAFLARTTASRKCRLWSNMK